MKEIGILRKSITNSDFSNKEELLNIIKCIERNLKNKKYGLVWEDKSENIKENLKNNFIYLEEDVEKRISKRDDKPENILIEGDNLESLMALQYTHKGKVDVIYIDPPYNTGNKDFIYNDKYIDKEDIWKHSYWLSFMNKRLKLAKELLNDKGVIFISIDDNEHSQLKLLCDEILGESNFISNLLWRNKKGGGNNSRYIAIEHEYILVYAKNITKLDNWFIPFNEDYLKRYKECDEVGYYYWDTFKRSATNQVYEIVAPDGEKLKESWLRNKERFEDDLKNGEIKFVKNKNSWSVQFKQRLNSSGKKPRSILYDFSTYSDSNSEIKNILKNNEFSYPKPKELIKHLIQISSNKNSIILDFFAGSGTTGHAVLELNKEDGGNRKFIICTNNENNICEEVTYQRINKVINGYANQKGEEIEGIPSNLRYYKTQKIEKTNNNELDQFNLLNKTLELIQIKENAFEITKSNNYYTILNNNEKVVGLYLFGFIDSIEVENMLGELIKSNKENKVVYVPVEDISEIYDYIDDKYIGLIEFEKMPKELIEIYNKLNRN